jgi:hypothetical protein
MSYTKGCDPELFLKDVATGNFISSIGLIGGSKDFPMPIGEGCAVQEDNVAVEFNIPPASTAQAFVDSINFNLKYLRERAQSLGLELCIQPSAVFSDDQLMTPAAQEFGCEPDFNAWKDGEQNPRPKADNKALRSAGGHIHIAVPEGVNRIEVVKAMDLFVGCQMLEFDTDTDRRKLYGKAGAFRMKPYGVEYRTASNAWITSDERIRWAWDQTERAVDFVKAGNRLTSEQGERIQKCLNESNMELYAELKSEFSL